MAEQIKADGGNRYASDGGRRVVPGAVLVRELAERIHDLAARPELFHSHSAPLMIDALVRAGELECALSDAGSPEAERLGRLTDQFAKLLLAACCSRPDAQEMLNLLPREAPDELQFLPGESYAQQKAHPLEFADLAAGVDIGSGYAAVIGVRSIGTTLSAVALAALQKRGVHAERITVRPAGHPYACRTGFSPAQVRWIAQQRAQVADFMIVGEGPGAGGSSLLSVGEALLGAGVPRARIQFLCSQQPDALWLGVEHAAQRWSGFRSSTPQGTSASD